MGYTELLVAFFTQCMSGGKNCENVI